MKVNSENYSFRAVFRIVRFNGKVTSKVSVDFDVEIFEQAYLDALKEKEKLKYLYTEKRPLHGFEDVELISIKQERSVKFELENV